MNIKETLFKWKRAIRKNRETISRVISITLTVALFVLVGVLAYRIYQADLLKAEEEANYVDKSPIVVDKNWDYGESGFQQVAENKNLILSADYTTGEIRITEKETGKEWFSNPQDREEDKLVIIKNRIHAQIHVNFIDVKNKSTKEQDNFGASIQKGGMTHKLVENGVRFEFIFPAYGVIIPVQYTLCEDGFLAEVLTGEIQEVWPDGFLIESITLLPFFGAGGLEDEGYLFVPDGTGALIDYNNNKQKFQTFITQVYGDNLTLEKTAEKVIKEQVSMPVFGAKCNDSAFFSVITSGEASSVITATTSRKTSSYNQVYSKAIFRESASKKIAWGGENHLGAVTEGSTMDYTKVLLDDESYAVRYFFLNGEDADYTGMSKCYREYLKSEGLLNTTDLAGKKYLVLDLIGAVSIEKYVVGIKMPVVTALTTYNDVCQIVKELKEQGVENLIINYIGALDGGLSNKVVNVLERESVLGSKKEFRQMIDYLAQEDVLLFIETNPIDLFNNGNGFNINRDSVRALFDQHGFQYNYKLDSHKQIADSRWHLLKPALVPQITESFAESAMAQKVNQISFDRLGDSLYSDYDEDAYTTRTNTLALWEQALAAAADKADYVMVHGGNAYCAAYADVITDTAVSHSKFDMEDRSVPFYQMTFQSDLVLTADGGNTTVDYHQTLLKALETGCSVKYNLIYGDITDLVGTEYNNMVSYSYAYWKDAAVSQYKQLQEVMASLAGQRIVDHQILDTNVTLTQYESASVIVNYGTSAYNYNGKTVNAGDYLVIPGGAK